ncbi:MAG TPA: hypothetical protein PKH31_01260 [Candidatus Sumerlaeota bacterium]|nr:hypothetical protein [Candidatus Sumerlaeota bacterium]
MRAGWDGVLQAGKRVFVLEWVLGLSFLMWGGGLCGAGVSAQDFENWLRAAGPQNKAGQATSSTVQARPIISGTQKAPGGNNLEQQTSGTQKTVGVDRLAQRVTLDTATPRQSPRNVPEILTQLHELTGVDFLVTCGEVPAQVLHFDKIPLREALDALLLPSNLTWEEQGGIILVKREKLEEQVIRLTDAEVQIFKTFEKKRWFERQLFNSLPKNAPAPSFAVDEPQGVLRLTAGKAWIEALGRFLDTLRQSGQPDLRGLLILLAPRGEVENIRRELESVQTQDYAATAGAKRVFRTGGDYLVLEPASVSSPELEKALSRAVEQGRLQVPDQLDTLEIQLDSIKSGDSQSPEYQKFLRRVYDELETLLYQGVSRSAASQDGRKLLPARESLGQNGEVRLTVVDFPHRIAAVQRYLERAKREAEAAPVIPVQTPAPVSSSKNRSGLSEIGGGDGSERVEILQLRYQTPATMAGLLDQVYPARASRARSGVSSRARRAVTEGSLTEFTLTNPEDERVWRDLTVRLVRVTGDETGVTPAGGTQTRRESECELAVRTAIRGSQRLTLREYDSQTLDNYELTALRIRVGGGRAGGSVTLRVRYLPSVY